MFEQANRAALAELRAFQEKVRLEDEIAAEAVGEAARAHVEAVLERGIEATKKRTRVRDYSDVVKVPQSLCAAHRSACCGGCGDQLPPGVSGLYLSHSSRVTQGLQGAVV